MIHHTCDRCKRVIDPERESRYVVRIQIEVALEPLHEDEPADDRDHLLEIDEILERVDVSTLESDPDESFQQQQYDLCPQCYRKFAASPLGRERQPAPLGFSHN